MRLTQKAITAELHRPGHEARLESGDGYDYFDREGAAGKQFDAGAVGC
jgi:hypothetical protein